MLTAYASWELQRASGGRFILGLGTQVKGHNERRFSVPYEAPVPKLAEQVRALRACWAAFAGTAELDFRGDFYQLDLLPPLFRPDPIDYPAPPIFLAAMNPVSCRIAGEVADGIHIHPFHSVEYLRKVVVPAVEEGLARSGRSRSDFTLSTQVIVAGGQGEQGQASRRAARQRLAFYGSTRTYRAPLELHGLADVTPRLHDLMAQRDMAGMVAALPEEVIQEFSVTGDTWADVAVAVRQRYEGLLDRVSFYAPPPAAEARAAATAFAA
jgi:probable F420-dependent oxidoreductase